MSRTLQFRRLDGSTLANTMGANGELIINSTNKTLTVHDGILRGGYSLLNSATGNSIDQVARNTANSATINTVVIQGVNLTQNTNITNATNLAQAAFNAANTSISNTSQLVNGTKIVSLGTDGYITLASGAQLYDYGSGVGNGYGITDAVNGTYIGYDPDDTTGALHMDSYNGKNIRIRTTTLPSTYKDWLFSANGNLTLPVSGDIVDSNGTSVIGNLDIYKFAYGIIGTKSNPPTNNGWGGYSISLDPGGESYAGMYIPNVEQQNIGDSISIYSNKSVNNDIFLSLFGGSFTFGGDGKLTFPAGYSLPNTTGSPGQVLTLNEDNTVTWQNQGGDVDTNIWVEEFQTDTPLTDTAQLASSIEYDSQGNIYALMIINANGDNYYAVSKFDTTGSSQWHTRLQVGISTDGWGLAIDNNGGYIYVAGRYNDGVYDKSTLTKLAINNGAIVWSTTYDFGSTSNSPVVDVDADGNPVIVGYANNGPDDQVTIVKINQNDGAIIWARGLDGQGSEQAYGMAVGPAGEVVAIGYMDQLGVTDAAGTLYADPVSNPNWNISSVVTVGGVSFNIFFTDGIPTFTNVNDTLGGHVPDQVLATIDGSIIGGVNGVDDLTVKVGILLQSSPDDRMLVAKYDSAGNVQWQKAVLFDPGYNCSGADADIDSMGNIYVCGQYQKDIGDGNTDTCMSLVKFDSNGGKQWSRRVIGNCLTLATSVVVGPDDCLYLSGLTGNVGTEDFIWVVAKYDENGAVVWQQLLDNTAGWSFPGGLFFSNGGGSNIAVKDGYFAVSGGKSALLGNDFRAAIAQFDAAGTPVVLGDWDFKPATFSGTLNLGATDIAVVNANKVSTDISESIAVATVSPDYDTSNFLIGTVFNGNTVAVTGDITFDGIQIQGATNVNVNGSIELVPNPNLKGAGQYLNIYPTNTFDYPHIHIAAGTGGDLFVGDDNTYFSVGNDGNLKVNNNGGQWQFDSNGHTKFPTLTVPISDNANPSGTGQTIKFSDSTQQAIIHGPASTADRTSAERIIIQGAPGYTGTGGEGGDVYVWAGPGGDLNGNGGDIKVRAGRGNGSGQGGYLNFQAGDSSTGHGGYINIESGQGATNQGGHITIRARNGGDINLYTVQEGKITLSTAGNSLTFAADGKLTLPGALVKSTVAKTGVASAMIGSGRIATITLGVTNNPNLTTGVYPGIYVGLDGGFEVTITVDANKDITATVTNAGPGSVVGSSGSIDGGFIGGTTVVDNLPFTVATLTDIVVATPVDLTKSINKLADGDYTLADGVEGQIMHLVRQTGSAYNSITVNVANGRVDGTLYTTIDYYPFENISAVNMSTLIFTDGAWQSSNGGWD